MTRDERALAGLSAPLADLRAELDGKRVALIGNARALAGTRQGAEIDAHDVVIRINRAPIPSPESHGTRTDWLGLGISLPAEDRARLAPRRSLYMAAKRRHLDWCTASSSGFYLHPRSAVARLAAALGAKPTTGALLIDLLLASPLAALDLHGFDFFASRSLSGRRSAAQVPHDFSAEATWVERLIAADPRLRLHPSP
nr:glycosyltransferase family 29 protein [Paracoccus sp. S-4012]